jgi:hypothetical protein
MEIFFEAVDQDDVDQFMTHYLECNTEGLDMLPCWSRAIKSNSRNIIRFLNTRCGIISALPRDESDLSRIRVILDWLEQNLPSSLNQFVDIFYERTTSESRFAKQYLLTRGYLPTPLLMCNVVNAWYLLTTTPYSALVYAREEMELFCHLDIVPFNFGGNLFKDDPMFYSTYFRYDNFILQIDWVFCHSSYPLCSLYLEALEALLFRRSIPLTLEVVDKLRHDIGDKWKTGEIKVGERVRALLHLG